MKQLIGVLILLVAVVLLSVISIKYINKLGNTPHSEIKER